jgi:hypothetical protein
MADPRGSPYHRLLGARFRTPDAELVELACAGPGSLSPTLIRAAVLAGGSPDPGTAPPPTHPRTGRTDDRDHDDGAATPTEEQVLGALRTLKAARRR